MDEKIVKMAILIADPIDMDLGYDTEKIIKCFSKLDIEISVYYLSEESLNNLIDYEYIFIFSKTIKNRLIIESAYFKTTLVTFSQLEGMIWDDSVKGVFIFSDKHINKGDIEILNLPIVQGTFKSEKEVSKFIYDIFKKNDVSKLKTYKICNEEKLNLKNIKQGKAIVKKNGIRNKNTVISDEINPRRLINFVGRVTDVEDLLRKLLELDNRILTIKGSGGIGKTTIVLKVALELLKRNYFEDGIHFIDCEHITEYEKFEHKIASCFDLDKSFNFKESLKKNTSGFNKLIILDNFEPLLYISDVNKIKALVSFICDYSKCVITSREWIGVDFEEKHQLRSLTTEEANELFNKLYPTRMNELELSILKEDILEKLLNNNPLAIKIITKNIPKNMEMYSLKQELMNAFFDTTNLGYRDIYKDSLDKNIERTESLFHSINYSYVRLTEKEQRALEMLSLFPNGIHLENFKIFFESEEFKKDFNKVTYREIKLLEDKSLVETYGPIVKLQSIIGRFAEFHFERRSDEEKSIYYKRAFRFNDALLDLISNLNILEPRKAFPLYDQNADNLQKAVDFIGDFEGEKKLKLEYIGTLNFEMVEISNKIIESIKQVSDYFEESEGRILIDIIVCRLKYYQGSFDEAYSILESILPFEKLETLFESSITAERGSAFIAASIYLLEGKDFEVLKILLNVWRKANRDLLTSLLFKLGYYKALERIDKTDSFEKFDLMGNQKVLDDEEISSYIKGLFKKSHLEKMQATYIRAKSKFVSLDEIEKLVVTNPYSLGLEKLMKAFIIEDAEKSSLLYESAIKDLEHIRYYYVEAIYFYARHLKEIESNHYYYWFEKGYNLAEKHWYRFLIHQFNCLKTGDDKNYDEDEYPIPIAFDEEKIADLNRFKRESYALAQKEIDLLTKNR